MKHTLPPLPYALNALEPFMSADTLETHHEKHHGAYVKKLNELIQGVEQDFQSMDGFQEKFIKTGTEFFGSGWLWLVEDNGTIKIETTTNGDAPIAAVAA